MKIINISKSYGKTSVLKNISLSIKKGEKIALLGSNGAGKSTLMNIINSNSRPSSGTIDFEKSKISSKNSGYIMQNMSLPLDARGHEIMSLFAQDNSALVYGRQLVKQFNMTGFLKQKFSSLSGGQKQKLFLVSMLQNRPDYFFLDEITTGLDANSRAELFKFLTQSLDFQQATSLLVTHYIEEAIQICDRFIVLKDGQIAADLKKSDLVQKDYSKIEFKHTMPEFEAYQISSASYSYKIPKPLLGLVLTDHLEDVVKFEQDYTIEIGDFL